MFGCRGRLRGKVEIKCMVKQDTDPLLGCSKPGADEGNLCVVVCGYGPPQYLGNG